MRENEKVYMTIVRPVDLEIFFKRDEDKKQVHQRNYQGLTS